MDDALNNHAAALGRGGKSFAITDDPILRLTSLDLTGRIIAVDFDGTCVMHDYPLIGEDVPYAVAVLKALTIAGARLILWTMRSDPRLDAMPFAPHPEQMRLGPLPLTEASLWFHDRDIKLWAVSHNPEQRTWSQSPKAYAHLYIDDAALGCPLKRGTHPRAYVDWLRVAELLIEHFQPQDASTPRCEACADPACCHTFEMHGKGGDDTACRIPGCPCLKFAQKTPISQ